MTEPLSMLLVLIATLIGAMGPVLFKKAGKKPFKEFYKNIDLILGVFMYGVSAIIFIIALRKGELSVLYPLVSFTYIWAALLSQKYLGERMNVYKWTGIGIIIIGAMFIGLGS